MSKFLVFYGSLLFIFIYSSTADLPYKCIHEEVVSVDLPDVNVLHKDSRSKRESYESKFQPLKIHTHMDEIDPSVNEDVIFILDKVFRIAESYFANTLNVTRTLDPFYLERNSCAKVWKSGPNIGKCAQWKSDLKEYCLLNSTPYVIPDRYLNSIEKYYYNDEKPYDQIPEGDGVPNANFILFVIMRTTSLCKDSDVQAYGSYCKFNSQKRPVAGLLNLCPEFFSKKIYKQSHYFNIIRHEIIHILGFSSRLYPLFQGCADDGCMPPKNIMYNDSYGIQRLVFPQIVQNMQAHFNCNDDYFGGPLANDISSGLSSHWHPLLMYTSIMTPSILEGDYVVVDNITLALLASTGWYMVNFFKHYEFVFGRGEGCNFGLTNSCETSRYLCDLSSNSSVYKGCDTLQLTIGKCESIISSHPCGTFVSKLSETCMDEGHYYGFKYVKSFSHERRCITLRSTPDMIRKPSCMTVRCRKLTGLDVYLNSSWVRCPLSEKVQVNDSLTIECPRDPNICDKHTKESERQFCTRKENFALSVRIYFQSPSASDMRRDSDVRRAKARIVDEIASMLDIPVNYIVNATIFYFRMVYLEFDICPPKNINYEELRNLISQTQKFLKTTSIAVLFPGPKPVPIASRKHMLDPEVALAFSDDEGFHSLIIVPVICAIFVIATFIASLSRYFIIQRHRPKRQTVEMENLEQSNVKTQFSNEPLI